MVGVTAHVGDYVSRPFGLARVERISVDGYTVREITCDKAGNPVLGTLEWLVPLNEHPTPITDAQTVLACLNLDLSAQAQRFADEIVRILEYRSVTPYDTHDGLYEGIRDTLGDLTSVERQIAANKADMARLRAGGNVFAGCSFSPTTPEGGYSVRGLGTEPRFSKSAPSVPQMETAVSEAARHASDCPLCHMFRDEAVASAGSFTPRAQKADSASSRTTQTAESCSGGCQCPSGETPPWDAPADGSCPSFGECGSAPSASPEAQSRSFWKFVYSDALHGSPAGETPGERQSQLSEGTAACDVARVAACALSEDERAKLAAELLNSVWGTRVASDTDFIGDVCRIVASASDLATGAQAEIAKGIASAIASHYQRNS